MTPAEVQRKANTINILALTLKKLAFQQDAELVKEAANVIKGVVDSIILGMEIEGLGAALPID